MAKKIFNDKESIAHGVANVKVVGIGGGGGNAISRMRRNFSKDVDFIAINTDAQDLEYCNAKKKIHIGKNLTKGLGTGMNPELGRQAAEETRAEIVEAIKGADLVFLTAGLGGGTGSGALPVVAEAAKEMGALTVAVVTKPFSFEGAQRSRIAQEALVKLKEKVDTLIIIPNDRIFSVINKDTPLVKAFDIVDDVLRDSVAGIVDLVAMPGIINVDFADIKSIMHEAGTALVGIGSASGQDRAAKSVSEALNSPLLEVSIEGAKGVLFGVAGGKDLRMSEVNDIARNIADAIDSNAKVIFGAYHDNKMKSGQLRVTVIATGFNGVGTPKPLMADSTLFSVSSEPVKKMDLPLPQRESAVSEEKFKNPKPHAVKKSDDVWDIPTFLRKKK
ncbi:MAG: cell division protein FtsZ [bacterium]|nr:cell division protein FtsZ [bacterium]